MATVIDAGGGRFIAGDPVESLGEREHWCDWCAGAGLTEEFYGDNWTPSLEMCRRCDGRGARECNGRDCDEHELLPRIEIVEKLLTEDEQQAARLCTREVLAGRLEHARMWALEAALHRDAASSIPERAIRADTRRELFEARQGSAR